MKRMIAFLIVAIAVSISAFLCVDLPHNEDYESVVVVSAQENLIDGEVIKNGNDFYYYLSKKNAEKVIKTLDLDKVSGIVYYFSNKSLDYFNKKLNYSLTSPSNVGDRTVYYGYDKSYYDFRLIDGKKMNVQLANDGERWILGYPMILTGF